jgi:gluconate 5-dehydrogenase
MKGPFDLTGRRALVTGSSRGLGFAIARGLAQAGAAVILNGRDAATLVNAGEPLIRAGYPVEIAAFDVADPAGLAANVARLQAEQPIDILVNNAGLQIRAPLVDQPDHAWQTMFDVHVMAAVRIARLVAPEMIERRQGKIINICSLMSEVTRPTVAPYTMAKGALKMLTKAMAVEWAAHNIQVNGIGPGYFATEMNTPLMQDEAFNAFVTRRTPAARWGRPEELAPVAVFLSSHASDFVNGQIVYVDGGALANL